MRPSAWAIGSSMLSIPLEEDALGGGGPEADPEGGVFAVLVPGEGGVRLFFGGPGGGAPGRMPDFIRTWKPLQMPRARVSREEEFADGVAEAVLEFGSEDDAGAEVVAVAESAGEAEGLEVFEEAGVFEEPEEVDPFGGAAASVEGVGGFDVAVGAGGSKDADARAGHDWRGSWANSDGAGHYRCLGRSVDGVEPSLPAGLPLLKTQCATATGGSRGSLPCRRRAVR